jgi:hypothetical protein
MLLNALMSEPDVLAPSAYLNRAPEAAGSFMYFCGIMAVIIFICAALASLRTAPADNKK